MSCCTFQRCILQKKPESDFCQSLRIPLTQKIGFKRPKGLILQYLCLLTQNVRLFVRISDSSLQPEFSDTLIIPSRSEPQNIIIIFSLQCVYPSNTSIFILTTICVCMSTIWLVIYCHVTQQFHNGMQLITPENVQIIYSFWITFLSLIKYHDGVVTQYYNESQMGVKKWQIFSIQW